MISLPQAQGMILQVFLLLSFDSINTTPLHLYKFRFVLLNNTPKTRLCKPQRTARIAFIFLIRVLCLLFRKIATRANSVWHSVILQSDYKFICYSAEILHISLYIIEFRDFRGGVTEQVGDLFYGQRFYRSVRLFGTGFQLGYKKSDLIFKPASKQLNIFIEK